MRIVNKIKPEHIKTEHSIESWGETLGIKPIPLPPIKTVVVTPEYCRKRIKKIIAFWVKLLNRPVKQIEVKNGEYEYKWKINEIQQ